ncbi:Cro/CI family transcriptional regulator [Enterobacteriaceae bacterium ESL0689]|nr:Cro/CI family transcriptional regulator [Enterobacteriaceae bacterium ESL0689]
MYTEDAINFFGSKKQLALAAGIKIPSVYKWGKLVPESRAMRLQMASKGVLVYDPQCYDDYAKARREGALIHENHP